MDYIITVPVSNRVMKTCYDNLTEIFFGMANSLGEERRARLRLHKVKECLIALICFVTKKWGQRELVLGWWVIFLHPGRGCIHYHGDELWQVWLVGNISIDSTVHWRYCGHKCLKKRGSFLDELIPKLVSSWHTNQKAVQEIYKPICLSQDLRVPFERHGPGCQVFATVRLEFKEPASQGFVQVNSILGRW